jgi:hypothetical protein
MMRDFPEWMQAFKDLPSGWVPPDELRTPTHSPAKNLAIALLVSDILGNDALDLVGRWISEMARLNIWFKDPERRNLRDGEYPELLQLPGKLAERIYVSWCSYKSVVGESSDESADQVYRDLLDSLRSAIDRLIDAME